MKILLYANHFYLYVIELANALSKKGDCKIIILLPDHVDKQFLSLIDSEIDVRFFKKVDFVSIRHNLRWLKQVRKLFVEVKPDVVHVQSYGHHWFHWLYLCYPKYNLFNTIHDPTPHSGDISSLKGLVLMRQCMKLLPNFTKGVFVHGESLKKELLVQNRYNPYDVFVIPHGEFSIFKRLAAPGKIKVPKDSILFFGRIWAYKGLDTFLEAAKLVLVKYPSQQFVIAGKGEDLQPYIKQVETYEKNFIFFNCRIADEQVETFFKHCLFTVLPYKDATQSGVIPVAFAYSKTVIATNVGALPEVITDGVNGILIPPNNPEELANAMIKLIEEPSLLRELENGALQSVENELSWNNVAQKTFLVYKKYIK